MISLGHTIVLCTYPPYGNHFHHYFHILVPNLGGSQLDEGSGNAQFFAFVHHENCVTPSNLGNSCNHHSFRQPNTNLI